MTTYSISLADELVEMVEREFKKQKFANKSEFFAALILEKFSNIDTIENISEFSNDYKIIKERQKDSHFMTFDDILAEHNV